MGFPGSVVAVETGTADNLLLDVAAPPKASLKVAGDTWVFQVEGRAVLLNWSNGNAEVRR